MSNNTLSVLEPSVKRWDPQLFLNIFEVIVSLIVVFGNGVLIIFMIKKRVKLLKPNMFILSLAISDFSFGLIVGSLFEYVALHDVSQLHCHMFNFFGQGFARTSSLTIMVISVDRYVKLNCPLEYKTKWVGTKNKFITIVQIWALATTVAVVKTVEANYNSGRYIKGCLIRESNSLFEQIEMLITFVGSNVTALVFYLKILILVRDRERNVNPSEQNKNWTSISSQPTGKCAIRRHVGSYTSGDMVFRRNSMKPTVILGLIVVLNLIFVGIPPLLFSVFLICHSCVNEHVMHSLPVVFTVSSAVNPIIFAVMNKEFRSFITFQN